VEERLQKIIARAGLASRREAEDLIVAGRVTVNGEVVDQLGSKADSERDHIKVDGKLIQADAEQVYILLNKPKGVLSSVHDPEGRPVAVDLIKGVKSRIYPVGRLDFNTEGAMLLTNDGDLTHRLLAPKTKCPKYYIVKISGQPSLKSLERLERGVTVEGARFGRCEVEPLKVGVNSWLMTTLYEGKNHQIKKMFEHVGHLVSKLKRIAFAFLNVQDLAPGEWRHLTPSEVERLKRGDCRPARPMNPYRFLADYGVTLTEGDRKKLSLYVGRPRVYPSAPPKTAPSRPAAAKPRGRRPQKARTLGKLGLASGGDRSATPARSVSVFRRTDDEAVSRRPPSASSASGSPGGYAKSRTSGKYKTGPGRGGPPSRGEGGFKGKSGRGGQEEKRREGGYRGKPGQGRDEPRREGGYRGKPGQGKEEPRREGGYRGKPGQGKEEPRREGGYRGKPGQGKDEPRREGGYRGKPGQGKDEPRREGGYRGKPGQGKAGPKRPAAGGKPKPQGDAREGGYRGKPKADKRGESPRGRGDRAAPGAGRSGAASRRDERPKGGARGKGGFNRPSFKKGGKKGGGN